jgi:hypothetical protein
MLVEVMAPGLDRLEAAVEFRDQCVHRVPPRVRSLKMVSMIATTAATTMSRLNASAISAA